MRCICIRGAEPEAYAKGGPRGACRSQRARRWRAAPRGARWEREHGGRRLPHRQVALPGRPAALEAPGGAHQGRGPRQPLLPPVYLRSPRAALPLGGDAGQDAHHGLPGRRHQAAERGGGGGAGRRAAGRGHRLRGGRAVHLPGVLPPEQQRQEEGGGAELHLAGPAGAGGRARLGSGGLGRPAARDDPGAGGGLRRRPQEAAAACPPRGAPGAIGGIGIRAAGGAVGAGRLGFGGGGGGLRCRSQRSGPAFSSSVNTGSIKRARERAGSLPSISAGDDLRWLRPLLAFPGQKAPSVAAPGQSCAFQREGSISALLGREVDFSGSRPEIWKANEDASTLATPQIRSFSTGTILKKRGLQLPEFPSQREKCRHSSASCIDVLPRCLGV